MPHVVRFLLIAGAVALVAPAVTEAHFKLVEPAPWIVENPLSTEWTRPNG